MFRRDYEVLIFHSDYIVMAGNASGGAGAYLLTDCDTGLCNART